MDEGDLHQLRVFAGSDALGNATGVVATVGGTPAGMAEMAAWLGFPDTAFVHLPQLGHGRWRVDSFSPFEPLRVCTQTLLATYYVLAKAGWLPEDGRLVAETGAGPIRVEPAGAGEPAAAYVVLPTGTTEARPPRTPPPVAGASVRDPLIVDTGRARAYLRVDATELDRIELEPDRVLAYCHAEQVNGVCLVAFGADLVRLRVFTTSLGGREDVSTGGAAAGIIGYAQAIDNPLATGVTWRVRQGRGGRVTSAELYLRHTGDQAVVGVGGRVEPVAVGRVSLAAGGGDLVHHGLSSR